MNSQMIFYLSKKTGPCEKKIKTIAKPLGITITQSFFATTPQNLGTLLINSLRANDIIFIIGGFHPGDKNNIEDVLSNAFSHCPPEKIKKLPNPTGTDSYLIMQSSQLLIVLPDEPEQIEEIINDLAKDYIKNFIS